MKYLLNLLIYTQIFNALIVSSESFKCGVKLKSSVDGTEILRNEWPWLVSLYKTPPNEFICGGSIVSQHHVLTAAHCVTRKKRSKILHPSRVLVYLGRHNLSATEDCEWFHPHEILVHPDWESGGKLYDADLAILVSGFPIPFSDKISPVCLWTEIGEDEDNIGTVVGYGDRNDVPRQFQVQRVPSARCYEDFNMISSLASSRTFCAGGVVKDFDPCSGDSGGGFFIEYNGVWFIQGIVSATFISKSNQCNVSKYALYTKINEFLSWINMKNKDYEVTMKCDYDAEFIRSPTLEPWRKEKIISRCDVFGLSVVQPSGRIKFIERKSPVTVESMLIQDQDTVYLPDGIGSVFNNLTYLEIIESKLRFIERSNFEAMGNLIQLNIQSNPITHIPHDTFSPIKNLVNLQISSCKLKKLNRDWLMKNTDLRFLNISDNQLDSLPSALLQNNRKLEKFDASNNRLKFIDDHIFSNLRYLEIINLKENRIQNISTNAFNSLTSLQTIYLSVNKLKSLDVDTFANNYGLEICYIRFNQIDEFRSGLFRNNLKLQMLIIDNNKVKLIHNKFLDNLVNLRNISLSGMSISDLPFDTFFTLENFEMCALDNNDLEMLHKDLISKNLNLVYFGASFNQIKSLDPSFFRNNLKLRDIHLTNNRIKTIDQGLFTSLKNIEKIVLSYNLIESVTANTFSSLPKLRVLHLNSNFINKLNQYWLYHNLQIAMLLLDINSVGVAPMKTESLNNRNEIHDTYIDDHPIATADFKKCGLKVNASGLIVNGEPVEANAWPWLASLYEPQLKKHICGGSIISELHVLTAAHCVKLQRIGYLLTTRDFLVHLGKHNLSAIEKNSDWFHPHDILIHPDWETDGYRSDADLAILVAEIHIKFSSTMMPVCLWTDLEEDNILEGVVVGWGASEETRRTFHTEIPNLAVMRKVPSAKCYERFSELANMGSSRTFCAVSVKEDSGPCKGDSGGGFFVEENGVWYLQGIVASSMLTETRTCDTTTPTLFTKINEFLTWINLKNKPYDVLIRGSLFVTVYPSSMKTKSNFECRAVSATQPSGFAVLQKKLETYVDVLEVNDVEVVYLPNGLGQAFAELKVLEVTKSGLKFIERENFLNMENLEKLLLNSNPIANIPSNAFYELKNLRTLRISESNLVYLHRNLLVNNPRLENLLLDFNLIETLPSDLFRNNLELLVIILDHNRLKTIDNQVFKSLAKLQWLYLDRNRIQDISPEAFSGLRSLTRLNVLKNRLKGLHSDTFVGNAHLTDLLVGYNSISDLPQMLLKNNSKLKHLHVSFNQLKKLPDFLFRNLAELRSVELNGMKLRNLPADIFYTLRSLDDLAIKNNYLTLLDRNLLSKNLKLTNFEASHNQIEQLDPFFFRNNLNLVDISLSYNHLKSVSHQLFKNLRNVKGLSLVSNFLESLPFNVFSDLENLNGLSLEDNKLRILDERLFSHNKNLLTLLMDSNEIEHLPAKIFRENLKLSVVSFNYNRILRIEAHFDEYRNYAHLNFFGNICINRITNYGISQAAFIAEIRRNCI